MREFSGQGQGEFVRKITVGVADDHPLILRGVEYLLSASIDIEMRFQSESIGQLLDMLAAKPVDVLVCDYEFEGDPYPDGLDLLVRIRRTFPGTRVLFLSSHASAYIVSKALDAGAAGFIGKGGEDYVDLAAAIRTVRSGGEYLSSSLKSQALFAESHSRRNGTRIEMLSAKEATVVRMICAGMSIAAIAERLKRSRKTISNQKNAGMKKLGARNEVELATIMQRYADRTLVMHSPICYRAESP
ncbi:LuxR family transcriptional regulator [Burkholderia anthina]|uniref:LuxR family transcriptional regulator n=1 Tax=Burkholderia anthina TaxID=179879 RepID=A0A6P2GL42_9BURK|nr:LuxR family transcriptional regulator [Burkholderia anthina]